MLGTAVACGACANTCGAAAVAAAAAPVVRTVRRLESIMVASLAAVFASTPKS
jgi:hypothetical protein